MGCNRIKRVNYRLVVDRILPLFLVLSILLTSWGCDTNSNVHTDSTLPFNILNYVGTPDSAKDRSSLAFSDQGAWFAYGFPEKGQNILGFSGPFLMTQNNGDWSSTSLSQLKLMNSGTQESINISGFSIIEG